MKLTPVNGHLLIEPVSHETFMASSQETYQEVGVVVDFDEKAFDVYQFPKKGSSRVYFDSWLAARYPKNDKEFYWLVKWEDIRAIEYEPVSE